MREYPVRICEGLGVKFPGPTRQKHRGANVGYRGTAVLKMVFRPTTSAKKRTRSRGQALRASCALWKAELQLR